MTGTTTAQPATDSQPPCRREETALCDPREAALKRLKLMPRTTVPEQLESAEKQCMSEKQVMTEKEFLRNHSIYSAISSWLFAIAGATNIGVLCAISSKILTAAEQGKPIKQVMSNKKYNRIGMAMIAFGGVCMGVSNWLESKKIVTEWQLGAGKMQRKANIAENRMAEPKAQALPVVQPLAADTSAAPGQSRNWSASMQPSGDNFVEKTKAASPSVVALG